MKMNWETVYVILIVISVYISYVICILTIIKYFKSIPTNYKTIFYTYLILSIFTLVSFSPLNNNKFINLILKIITTYLEITFLVSVFNKILSTPKSIVILFYTIISTILIIIYTILSPNLNDINDINNHLTIIYFLFSILTLFYLKIYLKKISFTLNKTSLFNDPLYLLIIGLFFAYGISLPVDSIYSYLIIFEKPFFSKMIFQNYNTFLLIKTSEVLCFLFLNITIIKSLKCFKLT